MAYEVWISLQARDLLNTLKQNESEIYQQIRDRLKDLSTEREDFKTGVPQRIEVFTVKNWKIYYRVWHRLRSIDVLDILAFP